MAGADPYQDLLARLRSPDVGRVGAREMLREVLLRLPGAWDPRVLDAAREIVRKFPPLAQEFPVIEQLAAMKVTAVVDRALGLEETVLASIAEAGRDDAGRLLQDLRTERGRAKDERSRLLFALGRRLLELNDRKHGRSALREAADHAPAALRAQIHAILDDLPGAKGREWRAAHGVVVVPANPTEPPALRMKGRDVPRRVFVEERLLGAPLLSMRTDPREQISIEVTLEHDTERVRPGTIRPREPETAPMIGLIARDSGGAPIGVVCGAFVSPIERFTRATIAREVTHVSIAAGASSFADTRLEAVRPPNEGDGWLVLHADRPFVRTRSGCWLRHPAKSAAPLADPRVRFQVTRVGQVWVAVRVAPLAGG